MKKAIKTTLLFSLLLLMVSLFFSCGRTTHFEEFREFENMGWNRFEDQNFEFNVNNTSASWDIKLELVFSEKFGHRTFTFDTRVTTPGGEERIMTHNIHVSQIEENTAEPAPDNTKTGSVIILQDYKFDEAGTVEVKVQNRMSKTHIPGILEIGLVVEKS